MRLWPGPWARLLVPPLPCVTWGDSLLLLRLDFPSREVELGLLPRLPLPTSHSFSLWRPHSYLPLPTPAPLVMKVPCHGRGEGWSWLLPAQLPAETAAAPVKWEKAAWPCRLLLGGPEHIASLL